jgi:hypothetical protein
MTLWKQDFDLEQFNGVIERLCLDGKVLLVLSRIAEKVLHASLKCRTSWKPTSTIFQPNTASKTMPLGAWSKVRRK